MAMLSLWLLKLALAVFLFGSSNDFSSPNCFLGVHAASIRRRSGGSGTTTTTVVQQNNTENITQPLTSSSSSEISNTSLLLSNLNTKQSSQPKFLNIGPYSWTARPGKYSKHNRIELFGWHEPELYMQAIYVDLMYTTNRVTSMIHNLPYNSLDSGKPFPKSQFVDIGTNGRTLFAACSARQPPPPPRTYQERQDYASAQRWARSFNYQGLEDGMDILLEALGNLMTRDEEIPSFFFRIFNSKNEPFLEGKVTYADPTAPPSPASPIGSNIPDVISEGDESDPEGQHGQQQAAPTPPTAPSNATMDDFSFDTKKQRTQ